MSDGDPAAETLRNNEHDDAEHRPLRIRHHDEHVLRRFLAPAA